MAAPTEEERAQPYLWRFWRNVPRLGRVSIFDRTWYGRVLVERVEGFCSEADWLRAYAEINDFEHELINGTILVRILAASATRNNSRVSRSARKQPSSVSRLPKRTGATASGVAITTRRCAIWSTVPARVDPGPG